MKWISRTYIGVFMGFLYLPIGILVTFSFNESKGRTFTGFSLKWYSKLIHDAAIMDALMTTLIVAFVAAVFATIMGTAAAIGLEKLDKKLKSSIMALTYIPIINPDIITGVSFMLLFVTARKLFSTFGIDFQFGWMTLILSHITFNIPYVILNVLPKLRQMDNSLVDAAMDLGCNPLQAFTKVTIHEIKPGIVAGFLMSLTFSMDDFVVSYFTTGATHQTLSVMIYAMTKRRVSPEINALSTVIFAVVLSILIIVNLSDRYKIKKFKAGSASKSVKNVVALLLCITAAVTPVAAGVMPVFAAAEKNMEENARIADYDMEYYGRFKNKNMSVNVYNWGEYISTGDDGLMDVNGEFEKITGIKVNYLNFETNEGMYAKLKSGANSYDVIIPSDYMVSRLIEEKLIQPLNFDNIPNFKYIGKAFLNPAYDKENLYSVPYTWNRVAIIYNKKLIGHEINSLDALWSEEFAGNMLMFKNSRDAYAIALEKLGYDINTENPKELQEATELLKAQKPLVQAYVMDQIFDKMQGNEAVIAPYYVGDYYLMKEVNPDLELYIPENTNIFVDAACIPTDAQNKEAGEMYINFLNEPNVAADNIDYIMYSTPNEAAKKMLDEDTRNDPVLYPSDEEIAKCTAFINLSEETNLKIDQMWTDVLSEDSAYLDWVMPLFVVFSISVIVFNSTRKRQKRKREERR